MFDVFGETICDDEMKTCAMCGLLKHDSLFPRANGATYARHQCLDCTSKLNTVRTKLRKENKPPSEGYICPICLGNEEQSKRKGGKGSGTWCCDHDHKTHKFRGYLCHSCNRALGGFKDDVEIMKRAIEWLEK